MINIPALQPSLRAWLLEGPLSAHVPAYVAKLRRGRYAPYTCERNLNALAHFTHWLPMCHLSAVIILKKAVQTCPASSFGGSHGGNGRVILATT